MGVFDTLTLIIGLLMVIFFPIVFKKQIAHRRKYKNKVGKYIIQEDGFGFHVLEIREYGMVKRDTFCSLERAQACVDMCNKEVIIHE